MNYNYIFWNLAACFSVLLAAIYLFRYILGKYLGKLHRQQKAMEEKLDQLLSAGALDSRTRRQIGHIDDIVASLDRQLDSGTYEKDVADRNRQLAAISGKLDAIAKNAINVESLKHHLTRVSEGLDRVLWMFRFDAQQYEKTHSNEKDSPVTGNGGRRHPAPHEARETARDRQPPAGPDFEKRLSAEELDEVQKLQTVLDEGKSSYDAMMEYMRLSGKGGYEALKLLKHAGAPEKDH